ncbi:competence protein [Planococcus sp. CPCC 101016]|uniref:competence protein ComK n=1 Tax=Planococcus sp. CPCC 101016 TaxID=2599617 RepID=UPI0011B4DC55|nr:competence protein ComK [Planococcus sp. CPCC 101016]TWT07177.1 competence protein [Planococcus sp. CPCC 101016]
MKKNDENLIDRSVLFVENYFETERKSRIITKSGEYYSRDSVLTLIDKACMMFASTYEGRVKATRHNLKQHKKTTLLISEDGLAAYPTKSPDNPDCVWIFNHHYRLETITPNRTRILFDEFNVSAEVNVSIGILQKQRGRMYEMIYFYSSVRERNKF